MAAAALYTACTASSLTCARVASSGGAISLAEVALRRTEAVAVRSCSLLTLCCVIQRSTSVDAGGIPPNRGGGGGTSFCNTLNAASTPINTPGPQAIDAMRIML